MGANLRVGAQARRTALASAALLLWAAAAGPARAATEVRIAASADTTIFAEQSGSTTYDSISDGSGPSLWTSVIAAGVTRRALVRFNLSAVPAGSRVVSVQLQLFEIRARDEHVVRLHRVLAAWGEAGSNGGEAGVGAPAQPGDATWSHRLWPDQRWAQRGGDFVATPSSSLSVGFGPASYVWPTTPQQVADVQGWLAQPSTNHGWIVIGDDQGLQNAKRFASRNGSSAAGQPTLIVTFEQGDPAVDDADIPLPLWALVLLGSGLATALLRRRR